MWSKSLDRSAYVKHITRLKPISDFNNKGLQGFIFEDTDEVKEAMDIYDYHVNMQVPLMVDIIDYNQGIRELKQISKDFKNNHR